MNNLIKKWEKKINDSNAKISNKIKKKKKKKKRKTEKKILNGDLTAWINYILIKFSIFRTCIIWIDLIF